MWTLDYAIELRVKYSWRAHFSHRSVRVLGRFLRIDFYNMTSIYFCQQITHIFINYVLRYVLYHLITFLRSNNLQYFVAVSYTHVESPLPPLGVEHMPTPKSYDWISWDSLQRKLLFHPRHDKPHFSDCKYLTCFKDANLASGFTFGI